MRRCVSRRGWRTRIEDILAAIAEIRQFTDGLTYDEFAQDRRSQRAVEFNFAVIGEASGRIPEDVRARFPGVPWQKMRAMRNVVVHEYFGISNRIVWETARDDLPRLELALRQILQQADADP
jgi:uncharacterized protein with HEPN domain